MNAKLEQPRERVFPYYAREEAMLNAVGQTLELRGPSEQGKQTFTWSTKSKRALDLELRVQPSAALLAAGAGVGTTYFLYKLELSHGDVAYNYPGPPAGATVPQGMVLPHRGLVLRLSARELVCHVWFASGAVGRATTSAQVKVSAQPVHTSTGWPQLVPSDLQTPPAVAAAAAGTRAFPMDAREWRIRRGDNGAPVPLVAGVSVTCLSLNGVPVLGPVNVADFFEWQPIPPLALTNDCSGGATPVVVEYR